MRQQVNYFEKVIKILKELKENFPHIEISKHYILATDSSNFSLTDKELFYALQKHKGELDMNTLRDESLNEILFETEDLFKEVESDDEDLDDWDKVEWEKE